MKVKTILFIPLILLLSINLFGQYTIVLQPGPEDGIDAKSRLLAPDQNYGNFRDITAHATDVFGPNISRTYIYFDLSFIPEDAELIDARLSLYIQSDLPNYPPGQAGENTSVLQKIIESWKELELTYNNAPEATEEDQVYLEESTYELQNYEDIDVTVLVQDMIKYPEMNFGFRLKLITEIPNRTLCFASSDYEIAEYRPKLTIVLDCEMPVAGYSYNRVEDKYYFLDESDSATSWYWDFGDGNSSTLQNPMHSYADYGKYYVCLKVENECGPDEYCDSINYCPLASSYFQYNANGDTVNFVNLSSNGNSWTWDFGDGYSTTAENPFHYFEGNGPFVVCLTTVNDCSTDQYCDTLDFTGVPEQLPDIFNVIIYPNPNHGQLYFDFIGDKDCIEKVCFYDLLGKKVHETTGPVDNKMDISFLSEGPYLVQFIAEHNTIIRKLMVIY